jgi:hypothetical protein
VISFIGNRPILQVGRHQVTHYDTDWLVDALKRAAADAGLEGFPCIEEIGQGIIHYLENSCSLRMISAGELRDRVRRMLEAVGCKSIADSLPPVAPPVTISLLDTARASEAGFELAFFESLRNQIIELRREGAADIRFSHHGAAILHITGRDKWDRECRRLLEELAAFLRALDCSHEPLPEETAAA